MLENESVVAEVKIGEFKTQKKLLSFISSVRGSKIRLNREIAFVKGEKLSGILNGSTFKMTICNEGVDFEEVEGTNLSDAPMRQRLINDILDRSVVGYTSKFVISNLDFEDEQGNLCYLEVEEAKPIDKLRFLFEEDEKVEVSKKGLDFLNDLLGDDEDEADDVMQDESEIEEVEEKIVVEEPVLSYAEEQFKKMEEAKVNELKSRISNSKEEVAKYDREIKFAEKNLYAVKKSLGVLETRLETMTPADEANGYVFFVSDKQDGEIELDETTKTVATKIAELMSLKTDVLLKSLTEGYFVIKIAKKDNYSVENIDDSVYSKITNFDALGKFSLTSDGQIQYRGELNWHQLVSKMIRNGFEQDPEFDKQEGSNSYVSKEEEKS